MFDQSARNSAINSLSMSLRDRIKHSMDPHCTIDDQMSFGACEDANDLQEISGSRLERLIRKRLSQAKGEKPGRYMY